jgi:hypothetical protein
MPRPTEKMRNAQMVVPMKEIPLFRAASLFDPRRCTFRPIVVRSVRNHATAVNATRTMTGSGIPITANVANLPSSRLSAATTSPPVMIAVAP